MPTFPPTSLELRLITMMTWNLFLNFMKKLPKNKSDACHKLQECKRMALELQECRGAGLVTLQTPTLRQL
jgi:hypothetical protein